MVSPDSIKGRYSCGGRQLSMGGDSFVTTSMLVRGCQPSESSGLIASFTTGWSWSFTMAQATFTSPSLSSAGKMNFSRKNVRSGSQVRMSCFNFTTHCFSPWVKRRAKWYGR